MGKATREIDSDGARYFPQLPPGVVGFRSFGFYVNQQFPHPSNKCGQAAAFTMLTAYKQKSFTRDDFYEADDPLSGISPNWQWAGTSARRVEQVIERFGGVPHKHTFSSTDALVDALKGAVGAWSPACLLLDLARGGSTVTQSWIAGHWVVAYAFSDSYVYLSNYGSDHGPGTMTWQELRDCIQDTWLTRAGGMGNAYYTVT